jgi:hypothetical protein
MTELTMQFLEREVLAKHSELSDFAAQTDAIVPADVDGRVHVLWQFRKDLLEACYYAARYDEDSDPYHKIRREIRSFEVERARTARQITELKRFFNLHPNYSNEIGVRCLLILRHQISIRGIPMSDEYLSHFLSALETVFAYDSLGQSVKFSGRIHNKAHGCILFGRPIGKGQVPSRETMLAFNLVLLIRKASCGECIEQVGETMPRTGESHYPFVARLINAVLSTEVDEVDLRNRLGAFLERNPKARLYSWT